MNGASFPLVMRNPLSKPASAPTATINVNALILLDARPAGGETDAQIVQGAWRFEEINGAYSDYLEILDEFPDRSLTDTAAAKNLQRWAAAERDSWLNAVSKDPLLPEQLLPHDYLGRKAWRKKVRVLAEAGERLKSFRLVSH